MERKGFQKINSFERQNIRQTRLEEPKKLVVKVILVHEALDKLSQEWLQRVLDLMPSIQTLLNHSHAYRSGGLGTTASTPGPIAPIPFDLRHHAPKT